MGEVLKGHFRSASDAMRPVSPGRTHPMAGVWPVHPPAAGAAPLVADRDPVGPVFVDIDALAQLGSSLGRYVGARLATERARKAGDMVEVVHHGNTQWLDALTLEALTEEVRAGEVVDATTSFGRTEFRQVAHAFRAALSRILDGP